MEMQFVDSSNVERIGYDGNSNTLRVEFKNGSTYEYHNVPEHIFNGLKTASSVGGYLAAEVKNTYPYTKI